MSNQLVWKPQPRQQKALECPTFELFYGGAAGGGKSDFLLMDFVGQISYGAQHRGILFRRSFPELEELILRSYELYIPLGAQWRASDKTWTFPSGSTLKMRFVEADTDVHKYQSHQYTWTAFDELTNWPTDYCYLYMWSRTRSAAGVPCWVRAAGNPGGPGHAWVKTRCIDVAPPEHLFKDPKTGLSRVFIPALLDDNYILMKNDPEYERRLEALPEHLYRALRKGDWDVFAGQFFGDFVRAKHVVKPYALDPTWIRFTSLDWGFNKPFSIGWWAVTHDGRFIRYREWYGCVDGAPNKGVELPAKQVAEKAFRMSAPEGAIDMVADPACWAKHGLEGNSVADTFQVSGFTMQKGNNDRVGGAAKMHDLFSTMAHDGRPLILVFDNCVDFIRTIPMLVIDKNRPEDVETSGEDHVYDEARYAMMSRYGLHPQRMHRQYDLPAADNWTRGQGPTWKSRQQIIEDYVRESSDRAKEYNPLTY